MRISFLLFCFLFVTIWSPWNSLAQEEPGNSELYHRIKIHFSDSDELRRIFDIPVTLDHVHRSNDYIIAELSEREIGLLETERVRFDVLIRNMARYYEQRAIDDMATFQLQETAGVPSGFSLGSMGGFLTFDQALANLRNMEQAFPELLSERVRIGESIEGEPIYKWVMGSDLTQENPQALYTSLIHAREPASLSTVLYYMWWLLENYGEDSDATFILDNRTLVFVPIVNPDGYLHNQFTNPNGGGMHRKNRRDVGTTNKGVDLNRNFGPMESWNSPFGGSSDFPNSDVYRGIGPFSEPETAALRDLTERNNFKTAFNYHTFSNLLVYPFGYNQQLTPDSLIYWEYSEAMTAVNNYLAGTDLETVNYSTRGNSDDYMYLADDNKGKIIAFTPEVGGWPDGFWPMPSRIIPLAQENLLANKLLAYYAGPHVEIKSPQFSNLELEAGLDHTITIERGYLVNLGQTDSESITLHIHSHIEGVIVEPESFSFSALAAIDTLALDGTSFTISLPDNLAEGAEIPVIIRVNSQGSYPVTYTLNVRTPAPTSIVETESMPEQLRLAPNYPNPFNPVTQIRFGIPQTAHVTIEIFSADGRRLQVLADRQFQQGWHELSFDGGRLASGLYLYRVRSGNESRVGQMLLVK